MAIELDAETLIAAARDVRGIREEVNGDIKRLESACAELGGTWQGQAAKRFQDLMTRWQDDQTKLTTAMGDIADLLEKSSGMHMANEEEQSSMFDGLSAFNE